MHWTETEHRTTGTGDNRRTETITHHYSASETYFAHQISVYGKGILYKAFYFCKSQGFETKF